MRPLLFLAVIASLSLSAAAYSEPQSSVRSADDETRVGKAVRSQADYKVPRLVKFSGQLLPVRNDNRPAAVAAGPRLATFALYAQAEGGEPLWSETQVVNTDATGHYTVMLGSTILEGVPVEAFSSGEARWLAVTVEGQPEQPRMLLVSVPYALKAADAEKLGGKAASEFATKTEVQSVVRESLAQAAAAASISGMQPGGSSHSSGGLDDGKGGNNALAKVQPGVSQQGLTGAGATSFSDTSGNEVVFVNQSGTGMAVNAATTGTVAVNATTSSATGIGARGSASSAAGSGVGVRGDTAASNGQGVVGSASSPIGNTTGVQGQSSSATGTGVGGTASGAAGVGVLGTASSPIGNAVAVQGVALSATGIAGVFNVVQPGGTIFEGQFNGQTKIAIDSQGNVVTGGTVSAGKFIGDGSGLTGLPGTTGPQGPQGPVGPTGPQGPQGLPGSQGATGTPGAAGAQGATGATGAQGMPGAAGATGATGATGPVGISNRGVWDVGASYNPNDAVSDRGSYWLASSPNIESEPSASNPNWQLIAAQGSQGAIGATGAQGMQGLQGATGAQGATGPTGPPGLPGATGATGATGPVGIANQGVWNATANYKANDAVSDKGSYWLALSANADSEPSINNPQWQLIAAQGSQGATGATGAQGIQGIQGPVGATGAQGATGEQGPPGASPFSLNGNNAFYNVGSVGIGTASPTEKLDVAGNANVSGTMTAARFSGDGSQLTGTGSVAANNVFTGNDIFLAPVGIGTVNAPTVFDVHSLNTDFIFDGSNASIRSKCLDPTCGGANPSNPNGGRLFLQGGFDPGNGGTIALGGSGRDDSLSSSIVFSRNNIESMRIANGGNVGIGTANPSQLLDVAGNLHAAGDVSIGGTVTAAKFVGDGSRLTNVVATVADAKTLGGLPPAAFAQTAANNLFNGQNTFNGASFNTLSVATDVALPGGAHVNIDSAIFPTLTVGALNASGPALVVGSPETVSGLLTPQAGVSVPASGQATANQSFASSQVDLVASVFGSDANAHNDFFRWIATPLNANQDNSAADLQLQYGVDQNAPAAVVHVDSIGNISTGGTVTATKFIGDGSQLQGVTANGKSDDVPGTLVLRDGAGNFQGHDVTFNNIAANGIIRGDGSGLTGITAAGVGARSDGAANTVVALDNLGNFAAHDVTLHSIASSGVISGNGAGLTGITAAGVGARSDGAANTVVALDNLGNFAAHDVTFNNITSNGTIRGNGAGLTGITAAGVGARSDGAANTVVALDNLGNFAAHDVTLHSIASSGVISGNGAGLTGITAAGVGARSDGAANTVVALDNLGNFAAHDVSFHNVIANQFIGDGSQLANIPGNTGVFSFNNATQALSVTQAGTGTAIAANATAGGPIFSGLSNGTEVFRIDGNANPQNTLSVKSNAPGIANASLANLPPAVIFADQINTTGFTAGIIGRTQSANGSLGVAGIVTGAPLTDRATGIAGFATATTGRQIGVEGEIHTSDTGSTAARFSNFGSASGLVIEGRGPGGANCQTPPCATDVFTVDAAGNTTANGNVRANAYQDLNGNPVIASLGTSTLPQNNNFFGAETFTSGVAGNPVATLNSTGTNPILVGQSNGQQTLNVAHDGTLTITANAINSANTFLPPALLAHHPLNVLASITDTNTSTTPTAALQIKEGSLDGLGLGVETTSTTSNQGSAAILGIADDPFGAGLVGFASSTSSDSVGNGVVGISESVNGAGVVGATDSGTGTGVVGQASSTAPGSRGIGVNGQSDGISNPIGVFGKTTSSTPGTAGIGVKGVSNDDTGAGVVGFESSGVGFTTGIRGIVNSPAGTAGVFFNNGGGQLLRGVSSNTRVFSVDGNGTVQANSYLDLNGKPIIASLGTSAAPLNNSFFGNQSFVNAGGHAIDATGQQNAITGTTTSNGGGVIGTNHGTGAGVSGFSDQGNGISGQTNYTGPNFSSGVSGIATNPNGDGVSGVNNSLAGGTGVQGIANGTSGFATGVAGTTSSPQGVGVQGFTTTATGGWGVKGIAGGVNGVGVEGFSPSVGVRGQSLACNNNVCTPQPGVAGQFITASGGTLLDGFQADANNVWTKKFHVDSNGNVNANSYNDLNGAPIIAALGTAAVPQNNNFFGTDNFTNSSSTAIIANTTSSSSTIAGFSNTSGAGTAIFGSASGSTATAVGGVATASSGQNFGVNGLSKSPQGFGVLGTNSATSAGVGVSGVANSTTGLGIGVQGTTQSSQGIAGLFENDGGGTVMSGRTSGGQEVFRVDGSGNLTALSATFSGVNGGVTGQDSQPGGIGIIGRSPNAIGRGVGVFGVAAGDNAAAVIGNATNTTSTLPVNGVQGKAANLNAVGVLGITSNSAGTGIGVQGQSSSAQNGIGVLGQSLATTGAGIGVQGTVASIGGIAGVFDNSSGGGKVISGRLNGNETFSVDASGNVRALTVTSITPTGAAPLVVASTTPVANLTAVPVTYNAAGVQTTNVHIVSDSIFLTSTATLVNFAKNAVFSSQTSYVCTVVAQQSTRITLAVRQLTGSQFEIDASLPPDTVANFICVGN